MDGREAVAIVEGIAADEPAADTERPMRADARRNYDRLLEAAKQVFVEQGGGASMEAIAKQAGVGVGTLYRHFPKRIDVVEAVYRTDVDQLIATADAVIDLEPWEALVSFLEAFLSYAESKRTFLAELHEAFEKNPDLKLNSRDRIDQAVNAVLSRAQAAGEVRTDVDGSDLMQLLGMMCLSSTLTEEQGRRLLGITLDGLRQPTRRATN
jgi:AcrR family transcriptional regulator